MGVYDVIVVGSGATGGWAAKEMSERGFRVLVLEAGRPLPREAGEHGPLVSSMSAYRVQQRCRVFNRWTQPYFVDDQEQPYTTSLDQPFAWIRTDVLGGRLTLWGGQVYRFSDFDFQAAGRDGNGVDWPIRYRDLAPYYDHVERFLGVSGTPEQLPHLPDGVFQSAPAPESTIEQRLRVTAEGAGLRLIAARVTERPEIDSHRPCPHCGGINRGCHRYTTSVDSTLAAALATGRVDVRTQAAVKQIVINERGRARGVLVTDKSTREEYVVFGRVLFLCASTLESARIMLNSRSAFYPCGIANTSGVLGRYLTVHAYGVSVVGQVRVPPTNDTRPLDRPRLLYMPRWQNLDRSTHPAFPRGYGCVVAVTPLHQASSEPPGCFNPLPQPDRWPTSPGRYIVGLYPFGETIPSYDNYVEIDPDGAVDAWGIPALRIHYRYNATDYAMAADMVSTSSRLLRSMGGALVNVQERLAQPGLCIHEAGTCRMGADPGASVLNGYNQCHDVPQLFVVDGGAFPSLPPQNPTLTMMALTVRACDYAQHQVLLGEPSVQPEEA